MSIVPDSDETLIVDQASVNGDGNGPLNSEADEPEADEDWGDIRRPPKVPPRWQDIGADAAERHLKDGRTTGKTAVEPPANRREAAGKPLENRRKTAGKPLENRRKTAGKPLENRRRTAGKLPETTGKTAVELAGKRLENRRKTALENRWAGKWSAKPLENRWKTAGKLASNCRKTGGKPLVKPLLSGRKTVGKTAVEGSENYWKTGVEPSKNRWKTVGKTAVERPENRWKAAGGPLAKTVGKPPKTAGKSPVFGSLLPVSIRDRNGLEGPLRRHFSAPGGGCHKETTFQAQLMYFPIRWGWWNGDLRVFRRDGGTSRSDDGFCGISRGSHA